MSETFHYQGCTAQIIPTRGKWQVGFDFRPERHGGDFHRVDDAKEHARTEIDKLLDIRTCMIEVDRFELKGGLKRIARLGWTALCGWLQALKALNTLSPGPEARRMVSRLRALMKVSKRRKTPQRMTVELPPTYPGQGSVTCEVLPGVCVWAWGRIYFVGDTAVYDSYNLVYTGRIDSITEKSVSVWKTAETKRTRLPLNVFVRRNERDLGTVSKHNSREMQCI